MREMGGVRPEKFDICHFDSIGAFLDGELSPEEEALAEEHLAVCPACREELNLQKKMLSVIAPALAYDVEVPDVPADFARVVTVRAESNLERIRNGRERSAAGFISAALLVLAMGGLAFGGTEIFAEAQKLTVQAYAVLGFFAHSIFELGIGVGVILKGIGGGLLFNSIGAAVLTFITFVGASVVLSRIVIGDLRS